MYTFCWLMDLKYCSPTIKVTSRVLDKYVYIIQETEREVKEHLGYLEQVDGLCRIRYGQACFC